MGTPKPGSNQARRSFSKGGGMAFRRLSAFQGINESSSYNSIFAHPGHLRQFVIRRLGYTPQSQTGPSIQ